MGQRAAVIAAVAGLLLVGCTEEGEPDVADTAEPTAEVTAPEDVTADTGEPTVTLDTASPTDTETDAGAAATDEGTAAAGGDAALDECAQAVEAAGGLADVRNAADQLGPIFQACPSFEEFQAAAEAQLEGFQDVDLRPYVQNMCAFVPELAATPLCENF